jgi:hypothetical protein
MELTETSQDPKTGWERRGDFPKMAIFTPLAPPAFLKAFCL